MKVLLILALVVPMVFGHGILFDPQARLGVREGATAKKYLYSTYGTNGVYPLGNTILRTCGDEPVGITPVTPTVVYSPGSTIDVTWRLTVPHPTTPATPKEAIRIAVAEEKNTNEYTWTVVFTDSTSTQGDVSGSANANTDDDITRSVTLPTGFTCDHCALQWVWDSQTDGGAYLDCADVAIRTPLTITLTFNLHYTGTTIFDETATTNLVRNYFSDWTSTNTQVTLAMTSTDHYTVTVMLTDDATTGMPAEALLADFYAVYDNSGSESSFETALGGTISSVSDNSPSSADNLNGNPFAGAATSLSAGPLALFLTAIVLLFVH